MPVERDLDETQKMDLVVDVDTLQAQLARPSPNRELIAGLWEGINRAASIAGLAAAAARVGGFLASLIS